MIPALGTDGNSALSVIVQRYGWQMLLYTLIAALSLGILWVRHRHRDDSSAFPGAVTVLRTSREYMEEKLADGTAVDVTGFDNLLNFRDVGKSINSILGKKLVAENRLFRSARLDDITIEDRHRLRIDHAVKTIVDLRTKTEHFVQAKKRQTRLKDPSFDQAILSPVKIPGIDYVEVNVHGRNFEMNMLWKLSVWSVLKMVTLLTIGYRLEGVSILVKEAIQPRGLYGLGFDTLDYCGTEIAQIFNTLSSNSHPILIHCTQGKDRTGAIIALILLLLETPISAITADYCLSENELLPEKESRLEELREVGLGEEFFTCPGDWVERFDEYLRERYGGVRKYLMGIGVGSEMQEDIVRWLKV